MDKFRAPGRPGNWFLLRSLIFVGSNHGTCFLSLYWHLKLGNDSQIFWKICETLWFCRWLLDFWEICRFVYYTVARTLARDRWKCVSLLIRLNMKIVGLITWIRSTNFSVTFAERGFLSCWQKRCRILCCIRGRKQETEPEWTLRFMCSRKKD